jgi:chromosome partitioning protein
MRVVVGFVSQKGGVGKSTLARALAAIAAAVKIKVVVADLDAQQQTVTRWEERREENDVGPALEVTTFRTASEAVRATGNRDELLIIDAPARASKGTLDIARHADLIVQPSGGSIDDLDPAIILFHELVREGVPRDRLVMALCRIANQSEETAARAYVQKAGYAVLPGSIPERAAYRHAHNLGRAVTEMGRTKTEPRADALMERLLAIITERVKARVQSAVSSSKKGTAA